MLNSKLTGDNFALGNYFRLWESCRRSTAGLYGSWALKLKILQKPDMLFSLLFVTYRKPARATARRLKSAGQSMTLPRTTWIRF
jgi:hypothetical protein